VANLAPLPSVSDAARHRFGQTQPRIRKTQQQQASVRSDITAIEPSNDFPATHRRKQHITTSIIHQGYLRRPSERFFAKDNSFKGRVYPSLSHHA